jgi:hypothetical protein
MSDRQSKNPPTVRMSDDEVWAFVAAGHTGILTTLQRDGRPIALPVWYATVDRTIYVVTRGKKVERIRHDGRCSFLVEAGERWAELRAVHLECRGRVIEPDADLAVTIADEMDRKYRPFRTSRDAMPSETRRHYARSAGATIELSPQGRMLHWDNRKLGIR